MLLTLATCILNGGQIANDAFSKREATTGLGHPAYVGNNNVLVAKFTVDGGKTTRVLVRAFGPSLGSLGIKGALQDPVLEIYDEHGRIDENNNWRERQEREILATGMAPADERESAIVIWLEPGIYTAVVRGKNDGQGMAVVESDNLPDRKY
jgi:hypothetical protein